MTDLVELARLALEAKLQRGDVEPQIEFLRALAKRAAASTGFRRDKDSQICADPRVTLLTDGELSTDVERPLEWILAKSTRVSLEVITARLAAILPSDLEVQRAAAIIKDQRPPVL